MGVRRLLRARGGQAVVLSATLVAMSCERPESAQLASASTAGNVVDSTDPTGRVLGRLRDRQLVVRRVTYRGPEGSDAPEQIEIAWRFPRGTTQPVDLGAPVLAAAVWRDSVLATTPSEALVRLASDGRTLELDRSVIGELAVSEDGRALAYARSTGNEGELVVRRDEDPASGAVTIARGFASIGAMRFSDDGALVCFVGARNGGVLGVHVARSTSDEGVRCLTNCTLRTGEDWGGAFVEVARDAASLRCSASEVSWTSRDGRHLAVALGGAS